MVKFPKAAMGFELSSLTIPKKPEVPIAPGDKGEITVRYDTNRVGVFRKTITVNTNVSSKAIIALKIKGNVLAN